MLATVNLLFLGCRTLILLDRSYMSRFWTVHRHTLAKQSCAVSSALQLDTTIPCCRALAPSRHRDHAGIAAMPLRKRRAFA